jgi:catechol 1,2-dioxygenase
VPLIGDFRRHDEPRPDAPSAGTPWYSLDYPFTLEPGVAKLPRPPIK